jgi:hypothetical protein
LNAAPQISRDWFRDVGKRADAMLARRNALAASDAPIRIPSHHAAAAVVAVFHRAYRDARPTTNAMAVENLNNWCELSHVLAPFVDLGSQPRGKRPLRYAVMRGDDTPVAFMDRQARQCHGPFDDVSRQTARSRATFGRHAIFTTRAL